MDWCSREMCESLLSISKRKIHSKWKQSARGNLNKPAEKQISITATRNSRCRFWKKSLRDDTTCSPRGSGCNKSPNQVDIWRMERWNWFLAASKSCVCQGGKRVLEKRTWGKWTTRDRFPTGFMPLFFIRRRHVPRHSTRRDTICRCVPFLRRRAFHFTIFFARAVADASSDINTIKCVVPKVLINSSSMWYLEFGHAYAQLCETLRSLGS